MGIYKPAPFLPSFLAQFLPVRTVQITAAMFRLVPILLAFAALTHADSDCEYDCEPIYTIQSDPFNLVLISEDPSLNGKTLFACHAGAAVFTLCPTLSEEGAQYPVVLTHNTTDTAITNVSLLYTSSLLSPPALPSTKRNATTPIPTSTNTPTQTFGTQGILSWTIPYDPYPIDLSVLLQPQDIVPLSIAQLTMTYSGDGSLSFDNNNILNFQNPITWGAEKPGMGEWTGYYRWWVCFTYYGTGYVRQTLVWGTGVGKPGKFGGFFFFGRC